MQATAIALFLLAALGGLVMAARIFRDRVPPLGLAILHGAIAATALVMALFLAASAGASLLLKAGVAALVIAALGGFYLLSFHLRSIAHPKAVVVAHALAAVAGVLCLFLDVIK